MFNLVNFLINNPCEDPNILRIILFIRKLMGVAFTIVPIVLIVLITFDFIKSVMANSEDVMKKNQKIVIKRLVYAVMLFFVIPIVNLAFSAFGTSGQEHLIESKEANYLSCWDNASDIDKINSFEIIAKFNGNGGVVFGDSEKSCGGSQFCEIKSLPNATKAGEKFIGWSDNDCYTTINENKIVINKSSKNEYKACWEDNPITETENGISSVINSVNSFEAESFWWPIGPGSDGKPVSTAITNGRNFKSDHLGLDINAGGSSTVPIIASYDGVVYKMGNDCRNTYQKEYIYGVYVVLEHNYNGKTIYTTYGHMVCDSIPSSVSLGSKVTAGTQIGLMGNTGNSSGTHLHFEVRENAWNPRSNVSVDPLKYISKDNPYPKNSDSVLLDSSNTGTNGTAGNSYNCNGRSVNISTKDGVTYVNNILVANKSYSLPSNYHPEGLSSNQLTKEATNAFNEMASAIKKEKNLSIWIQSGFRSYSTQQSLYNRYVNSDGKAAADTYSARPGHSEHQTGLGVDINEVANSFKNTPQGIWLNNNAYKYGFILRYPEGKQGKTGYMYEPWHYRYIGKDLAKELYNNGNWITVEEYFCIDSKYK